MTRVFLFVKRPSAELVEALAQRYGEPGCGAGAGWYAPEGAARPQTLHEMLADLGVIPASPRGHHEAPVPSDLTEGRCPCGSCARGGRRR